MNGEPQTETPPVQPEGQVVENATAASLFNDEPIESGSIVEPVVEQTPVVPVAPAVPVEQTPVAPVVPATPVAPVVPAAAPSDQPVALTADQLEVAKRILNFQPASAAPAPQQAPPQPQPININDPQVRAALGVYDLTESDYDAIFDQPDKAKSIAALNTVFQKVVRQSVTMANVMVKEAIAHVNSTISPYMQMADSLREQELRANFFNQHPDLVGQDVMIQFVQKQLLDEKVRFNSDKESFDEVAKRTKALIATAANPQGVQVTPVVPGNPTLVAPVGQPVQPVKRPMASLPSGGGGGGGGQPAPNQTGSSTAKNLFG